MSLSLTDFSGNIERFSGFADVYDRYRPAPPTVLSQILTQLANIAFPNLIVDLGSGTGLSTRYWADKANQIIGLEPTDDMRRQAQALTQAKNISYRDGLSHQTGLPDACADIVTCAQSLHWMEPQATFIEIQRILKDGGVFAAYDYDWPPTIGKWEAELAYHLCLERVKELEADQVSAQGIKRWEKNQHLSRMQASNCFRYCKEIAIHHVDLGNAERLHGLALSLGGVMSLIKQGYSEAELGLDRLKEVAASELGTDLREWYWSLRVRIGIK